VNAYVPARNCFELFGFDIMLDSSYKAWLIEVNTSPSLGCSSPVDRQVKCPMLAELMHVLGVVPYNKAALKAEVAKAKQARLVGQETKERSLRRDKNAVRTMSFSSIADCDLPDCVRESEAEWRRCQNWRSVLPCLEEPQRYAALCEDARCGLGGGGVRRGNERETRCLRQLSATQLLLTPLSAAQLGGPRAVAVAGAET